MAEVPLSLPVFSLDNWLPTEPKPEDFISPPIIVWDYPTKKERRKEYLRERYLKNREQLLKKNKKILKQHREYRLKNHEQLLKWQREYRLKNREKILKIRRECGKKNRE